MRVMVYGGGLDPIQIRRSDIFQSYWFLVRPLGPNFLRYAKTLNCRNSPFSLWFSFLDTKKRSDASE